MARNSISRKIMLVLLLAVFSVGSAYADATTQFRLRIEDATGGFGEVITGAIVGTTGSISFSNAVGNAGFVTTIAVSQTEGAPGAILTLSSKVIYGGDGDRQYIITLEDGNYIAPGSTGFFNATLGGFSGGPLGVPTATGKTPVGGSATFNSWIDLSNNQPDFGPDGFDIPTVASSVLAPATSVSAFTNPNGLSFGANAIVSGTDGGNVTFGAGPYAITSQAKLNFADGGGVANFTITSQVGVARDGARALAAKDVPEPTSLVLLGSGLLGLGWFRRKKA